jgi:nucleoid DNA-binding protein
MKPRAKRHYPPRAVGVISVPIALVRSVSERTGVPEDTVRLIITTALEDIKTAARTTRVSFRNFGTFQSTTYKGTTRAMPSDPSTLVTFPTRRRLVLKAVSEPESDDPQRSLL